MPVYNPADVVLAGVPEGAGHEGQETQPYVRTYYVDEVPEASD